MSNEIELIGALGDLGVALVFVIAWFWERRRSATIQDSRIEDYNKWFDRIMLMLERSNMPSSDK